MSESSSKRVWPRFVIYGAVIAVLIVLLVTEQSWSKNVTLAPQMWTLLHVLAQLLPAVFGCFLGFRAGKQDGFEWWASLLAFGVAATIETMTSAFFSDLFSWSFVVFFGGAYVAGQLVGAAVCRRSEKCSSQ